MLQRVLDRVAGIVDEIVVVARPGQDLRWVCSEGLRIVEDLYPGSGPLGGIYTGLSTVTAPVAIAVACDMPLLRPALLAALLCLGYEHDVVVPVKDGLLQPLCAAYNQAGVQRLGMETQAGNLRLTSVVEGLRAYLVEPEVWRKFDPEGLSFHNVNSETDLRCAEALLAASAKS